MKFSYKDLDITKAYIELKKLKEKTKISLKHDLDKERIEKYNINFSELNYNFAAKLINQEILENLQNLADEQRVIDKYKAILSGEIMNTSEKRMVLHHLARGQILDNVYYQEKNMRDFFIEQQNRIEEFANKIHSKEIIGSTGKGFDTIVQIGIGGSDLGPRALYLALKNDIKQVKGKQFLKAKFISNVDPDDANEVLDDINLESTLFIIVSKSGTTQETKTNEKFVIEKMKEASKNIDPKKHMIAITSKSSPMAESDNYIESFYINDFIGGRFSSTSAVGGAIISLAFGPEVFREILEGAHESDKSALNRDILKNASLMDALIGIWERNFLYYNTTAILPYSQALHRFPAHLQQLDMESNGKSVNREGKKINYKTGPIIFGESGTNGQHSFYQLLHQGTEVVSMQFIGFENSQFTYDIEFMGSTSQKKLNANLCAQIVAFSKGKDDKDLNKYFEGEKPSSLIYAKQLTPKSLGALLAHFENKVMFQGLIWNINSFDQEGVQLGKTLTKKVLSEKIIDDPALEGYSKLLNI